MPGKYLISIVGQSNEEGYGASGSRGRTSGLGAPFIDKRDARSWWPSTIEAMARRGKWLDVNNTAVGSTSLCDSWVGRCRSWVSGMAVVRGTYVLSSGAIWRCAATIGTVRTSTTQPVGTVDVTGADGTAWVYLGAPLTGDVDGAVYAYGSSRHDPNGLIGQAIASIGEAPRPGYDARGGYVSIGQTDHDVGSTRRQYSAAMQIVAQRYTSLGYHCWLGVTCGMSGSSQPAIDAREATMSGVIQAGRADALAALAGNPLVHAGADIRTALGIPNATADDTARNAVNNTDYLHLTSATYDQAGPFVAAAFAAGGW